MTRVAVVGAGGFIGGRAAEMLSLRRWAAVNAVVRSYSSAARIGRLSYDLKIADALCEDEMVHAFRGCDYVFHSVAGGHRTITEGLRVAARAAARAGVERIVYLSSGMVYGFLPAPDADDETPPVTAQPRGYNRSKALAETSIRALRRKLGVDIVVLRPTVVYGPRAAQFTVRVARDILAGNAYLVDQGQGVCNAVYVDNLVTAMWQAAITPGAANQTFIISDAQRNTWRDLYFSVAAGVGMPPARIASIPAGDAHRIASTDLRATPLHRILRSRLAHRMGGTLPERTRARLNAAVHAYASTTPWDAEPGLEPAVDLETVSMQRCETQLPIGKAQRMLGYDPIPTKDGFRRTTCWLNSVGFHLDRQDTSAYVQQQ